MKNHVQISIESTDETLIELLIAQLSEMNYNGFEQGNTYLLAYCNESDFDEASLQELLAPHLLSFDKKTIEEQNWNALWESNFEPVIVDDFVAVRADFHQPILNVKHQIIITPKMSFGTGHHATTHMMMQQMRGLNFAHKTVFDFGTGTGILAILAEKLGAESIAAIDIDEWSIANAKENIERNGCKRINVQRADSANMNASFHIILANINKNIILENLAILAKQTMPKGFLLLSGLLTEDEADVLLAATSLSLQHLNTIHQKQWISMLFAR